MNRGGIRAAYPAELSSLFSFTDSVHPLSNEAKDFFVQHVYFSSYARKEVILQEREMCNDIYFIRKGVVRGLISEGQREITTFFSKENEIITSVSSIESRKPSSQTFQAIEEVELFSMGLDELQMLFRQFPEVNQLARKLLQHYFAEAEKIALIARLKNAESKYIFFQHHFKELASRLPLMYVASFLSVSNETISRIRKKLSGINN